MVNFIRKRNFVFIFTLLFCCFFSFSEIIKITDPEPIQSAKNGKDNWSVNKFSRKLGPVYKGPFASKEIAIANWYYESLSGSKYCITKNKEFVCNNPETYFPEAYAKIQKDFEENRLQALSTYGISPIEKIENKFYKEHPELLPAKEAVLENIQKVLEFDVFDSAKSVVLKAQNGFYSGNIKIKTDSKNLPVKNDKIIIKFKATSSRYIPNLYLDLNGEKKQICDSLIPGRVFQGYLVFNPQTVTNGKLTAIFSFDNSFGENATIYFAKVEESYLENYSDEGFLTVEGEESGKTKDAASETSTIDSENKEENPETSENAESEKTEEKPENKDIINFNFNYNSDDSSINRYKKEYLQDFAVEDDIPLPSDEDLNGDLIENPDTFDSFGLTALMSCAKSGNNWQIENLIKSGADINLQDKDGWTALMYAARFNENVTTLDLLLQNNADVKMKNNFGSSALVIASTNNNNPEILSHLLNYYNISDKEVLKSFILLLTTNGSNQYIRNLKINCFIDRSIPLNIFYEGKTPLMYACQYSDSNTIIQLLLNNNASISMRSTEGKTAFDYAKDNKNLKHDDTFWSLNVKK